MFTKHKLCRYTFQDLTYIVTAVSSRQNAGNILLFFLSFSFLLVRAREVATLPNLCSSYICKVPSWFLRHFTVEFRPGERISATRRYFWRQLWWTTETFNCQGRSTIDVNELWVTEKQLVTMHATDSRLLKLHRDSYGTNYIAQQD